MENTGEEIVLPLTKTGRKYGYITWRKKEDEMITSLLKKIDRVNLQINNQLQESKRIDWNRRRIGITYSLTRNLGSKVGNISIKKLKKNTFLVKFY